MDMRPQAHDIIRTWLFATVVRSHFEHGSTPWRHAAISGFLTDPDRKKMSKSKGNVVVPTDILDQHGSDAVRYWSASARLGADTTFDPSQLKIGRRLAIKLLNASKFALGMSAAPDLAAVSEPLDRTLLARLATVIDDATRSFDAFNHARALEVTETFFWTFCDDYVELVKERAYGARGDAAAASAKAALGCALHVLLRLFAPFLPYVTEEVWSWWQDGSVHRMAWPTAADVALPDTGVETDPALLDLVGVALSQVRGAKSTAQVSMRTEVARAVVRGPASDLDRLRLVADDLAATGHIADLAFEPAEGGDLTVDVTL
jgi:valyl-tRNA synthetase